MNDRYEAARAIYLRALDHFPTSGPLPLGTVDRRDAGRGSLLLLLAIDHSGASQLDIIRRNQPLRDNGECVFRMVRPGPSLTDPNLLARFIRGEWEHEFLATH